MKCLLPLFMLCTFITSEAQTIKCNLPQVNSLDFFFQGDGNDSVVWPDSTIAEIEATLQDTIKTNIALQFLPLAMAEMNGYFKNGIDQDGFYRIIRYSELFATTLHDESWKITMNDFCPKTEQLINRFNEWYEVDTMLGNLLYTTVRGPYYGAFFKLADPELIYAKDSILFPGTNTQLYLGNYNDFNIIFARDAEGNVIHVTKILGEYHEEDVKSLFNEVKCISIEDFGFSVIIFVSDGVCRLYFDEEGNLRFYFIM